MLFTALAQLRVAASLVLGLPFAPWAFDELIAALEATRREFGAIGPEGAELLTGPVLDEATRRDMQLRRFRTQARRGACETDYYAPLFARLGLDPARLGWDDIPRLPVTPKEALRAAPEAFVRRTATPVLRALTTGTTGRPTAVHFSAAELRAIVALSTLAHLFSGDLGPEDVVQMSASARATLGNLGFAGACARLGALVYLAGVLEPAQGLALLREERRLAGKKRRTSVLLSYPSYLGELVERGLGQGLDPGNFGLERVFTGGELVTAGLKARSQRLFGPVRFHESYAMTETIPGGGTLCSAGHLHFEPAHGLLEVQHLEEDRPARPGEAGTLVFTPFPPFRETTILLRYDTEDVVRLLAGPLTCPLRHLPATTHLLGKLRLAVWHAGGWTFPRDVLEAVEGVEAVPLPARCGFWAVPRGVAVEVLVRKSSPAVRCKLEERLAARDVPLRELFLVEDPAQVRQPLPWRGDLREAAFTQPRPRLIPHHDLRVAACSSPS